MTLGSRRNVEGRGYGFRTGDPTDWPPAWVGARGRWGPVRWERGGGGVAGGRGRLGLEFPECSWPRVTFTVSSGAVRFGSVR